MTHRVKPLSHGTAAPLLYSREQAARLLGGVCAMTLIRMEKRGVLKPIRLVPSANGRVFYTAENIAAVARGELSPP
jgi:hypothetical protein